MKKIKKRKDNLNDNNVKLPQNIKKRKILRYLLLALLFIFIIYKYFYLSFDY